MSKHNGNFEVYGDIVVGANISGSKYILPHDKGDTGESLIMDGGVMIFANPAPYIDIAQTSGGAELVDTVNQLVIALFDISGAIDNFTELLDTPKPALSVNAHEGELIIVDPNASAQVQKIAYSGVTLNDLATSAEFQDLLSTTASISGYLQGEIDAIVQEGTTIASSGGSILVSQNGLAYNIEVASAPIQNHNLLSGLQGSGPEYYHLNATQFASISGGVDLSDYTLLSTTASISGDLQTQIDATATIGNCIIVRLATGNDATAQRGRLDLPFKTLAAAIAAATSGDEIKVFEQGTATTGTVEAIGVRIEMQSGAVLSIASGVTLFEYPSMGPQIYGGGSIILLGTARLIVGVNVNLSLDVHSYTAGANANGAYGIDLNGGIHHINIRSTLSQTNGAVGGAIRIQNSVVDIRIGGQVGAASSARTTPLFDLFACRGNLETGWNTIQPNANSSPVYEVGLTGNFTIRGGQIFAGVAAPFVRLKPGYTVGDNLNLEMYGVVSAGSGPVIEHTGGDWAVQVGITGPPGAGNAAIVADGTGADPGLGISGYVSAGISGDAIKAIPTNQVEITAKVYGDIAIANGSSIQMRGSTVVGTVKSISGTGTVRGVTPWSASTFPTAAVSGIVPTIDGGII